MANGDLIRFRQGSRADVGTTAKQAGQLLFATYEDEILTTQGTESFVQGDIYVDLSDGPSGIRVNLANDVDKARTLFAGETSTNDAAGNWTATIDGITKLYDGLTIALRLNSTYNSTYNSLNVNNLGAKIVWYRKNSRLTSHVPNGAEILLTYRTNAGSYTTPSSGSRTDIPKGTTCTDGWILTTTYDSNTVSSAYCTTGASTAAKAATCSGYVAMANSYIHIIFSNTNTANVPTLNINSRGAKPIYLNGQPVSSSNHNIKAGSYIAYYDGTAYYLRNDGILPGRIENALTADDATLAATASEAIKLSDTHTFQVDLGSTSVSTGFDGTQDIHDIGVTGTLGVQQGGTGTGTLAAGEVLIGNNTNAVTTRAITNLTTAASDVTANTNLITANTLVNYQGSTNQNTIGTITTGIWHGSTIGVSYGGTGITSNPSMLINLESPDADTVFKATPRPGVTGVLGVGNGGTGRGSITSGELLVGNNTSAITTIAKTSANTANTVVQRDASGNFSAGTITASLSGNATSATTATSAGQLSAGHTFQVDLTSTSVSSSFNGTQDIHDIGVSGQLSVGNGGTGRSSLTEGQVLVGNGGSAVTFRAILNNTAKSALGWNSNGATHADNLRLVDVNTIAYWNGAYSGTNSNISYVGTISGGTWQGSTIGVSYGGTGITSNPSMTVNLSSNSADTVFKASPSPGVTGTLGVGNGGTGRGSLALNSTVVGNNSGQVKLIASANGAYYATGANAEPQFGILPEAQGGTGRSDLYTYLGNTYATISDLNNIISANDALIFKGIVDANHALPTTHSIGWTYKAGDTGTYAGQDCEPGDMIICIANGTTANDDDWVIVQANIDGAVIGPAQGAVQNGALAAFNGNSGKIITKASSAGTSTLPVYINNNGIATTISSYEGNSATATKLASGKTIAISGAVTGTATSFDGSSNITIPTTAIDISKVNSGKLAVSYGGTGVGNLAAGQLLVGNDTSAVTTIAKTSANTANTVVQRDANGNFSAGTITATLSGKASTAGIADEAAKLSNSHTFQVDLSSDSVSSGFDGTQDISDIGVTGTLPVGNGGTGATSFTANSLIQGNGTSALSAITSTIGSNVKPIYLNSGVPTALATEVVRAFDLSGAQDLNTKYDAGMYAIEGGSVSNYPTNGSKYAAMLVVPYRKPSGNTKPDYAWQITTFTQSKDALWFRVSNDSTWRGWRNIVNIAANTAVGGEHAPVYVTADGIVTATGTIDVAHGGTGIGSLTKDYVLVGNGTSAVQLIAKSSANDTSTIVERDSSGNFSAGTITASLSGNATTATTATKANQLTNGHTFQVNLSSTSVSSSFNGTQDIYDIGVSGKLGVGYGGTGAGSFTAGALLQGNNTSAISVAATKGDAYTPIYINSSGIPTVVTGFYTQKLVRPNQLNGLNDVTLQSLVSTTRANRLAFLPADQIIIEKTTDGGTTWVDAEVPDSVKLGLFSEVRNAVNIPLLNGVRNINCGIRITFTAMKYNVPEGTAETQKYNYWNSSYVRSAERYCQLKEFYFWVNAVSDGIKIKAERATGANSTIWQTIYDNDSWVATGWSGCDYIRFTQGVFGGGTTQTGNYWNYRLTFFTRNSTGGTTLSTSSTSQIHSIYEIRGYGDTVWTVANNYMANDHLYTFDANKNAAFPAKITATEFSGTMNVSNLSGTVPAGNGGTGHGSLTLNATLVGNGTNAVKQIASAKGAYYATAANAEPQFGTLPVAEGGTGKDALTSGYALIGNGTNAVDLRAITNNTSATAVTASTNLITANTLYYHTGNSNIVTVGTISSGTWQGTKVAVSYGGTGQSSLTSNATLVGNGTSAVKLISSASGAYYATDTNAQPQFGTLPVAQGGTGRTSWTQWGVVYASASTTLTNTAAGTTGYPLIGAGSAAPAWYGGTVLTGTAAASWKTAINGTTAATSAGAGALTVAGGTYIAKNLYVGDETELNSTLSVGGNSTLSGTLTVSGATQINNTLTVGSASANKATTLNGNLTVTGIVSFSNTTGASTDSNGAVRLAGGMSIKGNIIPTHNTYTLGDSDNKWKEIYVMSFVPDYTYTATKSVAGTWVDLFGGNQTTLETGTYIIQLQVGTAYYSGVCSWINTSAATGVTALYTEIPLHGVQISMAKQYYLRTALDASGLYLQISSSSTGSASVSISVKMKKIM